MQHVPRKWLSICTAALAVIDVIFIILFLIRNTFEIPQSVQDRWGISLSVMVIASIHLAYAIFIYPFIQKQLTWLSNIISFTLSAMLFAILIDESGNDNLVYRLSYALLVFFMALGGPFGPLAAIILTWIVLGLTLSGGVLGGTSVSVTYNIIIDIIVTAAGFAGWLLFRRFYINTKTETEIQLTNLLKEEQFKSNVIIESISDGVLIVNEKGTIQLMNESAAKMLGWSKQEATNLDYRSVIKIASDTIEQKGPAATAIDLSMSSNKTAQQISHLETRNQRQLYVDIVASPIFGTSTHGTEEGPTPAVVGTIAVLRDVDAQKREEQRRSDFISTASHEMRTPVASIQGFLELALNPKVAVLDEKARGYLTKAHEATMHLGNLFQDLLTVSKSEDGRLVSNPKLIEVGELLSTIVEEHKLSAEKKGLKVSLDGIGPSAKGVQPLLYIHVDPDRLREVVINLFDNAVKYTKTGMITVGASQKPQSIVIRISDTGMGIAEEDISHLFQKFYRTDNSETREIGGTGLGLYICKQIVQLMRGKIWVESTVGAGSTFYVEIPRVDPNTILMANQVKQVAPQNAPAAPAPQAQQPQTGQSQPPQT